MGILISFGFALRDHRGNVVLAGKTTSKMVGNSTMLEGMAARHALQNGGEVSPSN